MKKVFLLMIFLCLALMAGAANDYRKVNNLWYLLSNDKKSAAVVASQDETSYQDALAEEVFIPDSIRVVINADTISVPVTEIHNNVFAGCSEITSATIKANITKIPEGCFRSCTKLTSVSFPTTLKNIMASAFYGCIKLNSIAIPDSVTTIYGSAFRDCSGMKEISIPDSVTSIKGDVFSGCSSLEKVNFASIKALCGITFEKTTSNPLLNTKAQLWINGEKQTTLVIPSDITIIQKYAFAGLRSVSSVDFSEINSLTIYADAFIGNSGYNKVIFKDAGQLCSIKYEKETSNPLYFGNHIYYQGNPAEITRVEIPSSSLDDDKIRPYILAGANSVTRIEIPAGAKTIGVGAFKGCGNFEEVGFATEEDFQAIRWENDDANPFANGKAIPLVNSSPLEQLTLTKDVPDYKYKNSKWLKRVILKEGVNTIGAEAFRGCTELTSVTFDNAAIDSIKNQAFHTCQALGNISLPNSVKYIGYEAFCDCKSTKFTEITIPENCTSLGQGAFRLCSQLKTVKIQSSIDIPVNCFQHCSNLQEVETKTTKDIGGSAFFKCTNLKKVPVTKGLKTIGDNAFEGCTKLTDLMLSETGKSEAGESESGKLVTIGKNAFINCTGVTMVSLPHTINKIMEKAFDGCTALADVYCLKDTVPVPIIFEDTFGYRESEIILHVTNPDDYHNNANWGKFRIVERKNVTLIFYVNDVQFGDTITHEAGTRITESEPIPTLVDDANTKEEFSGWDKPFPETMPSDSMKFYGYVTTTATINNYKYKLLPAEELNGNNLNKRAELIGVDDNVITQTNSKVTVPDYVTNTNGNYNKDEEFPVISIGVEAFKGQGELSEIILSKNIEKLGEAAFMNCTKLWSVDSLEKSKVTAFSDKLFQNCTSLSLREIPANIKAIGKQALSNTGCSAITIPASIEVMGNEVFKDCKSLKTVTFADGFNLGELPEMTFLSCRSLENVTLVGKMSSIGIRAFDGCSSLSTIDIPEGVKRVAKQSFQNCGKLANVTLPSTITNINELAFTGCKSLAQIVVNAKDVPSTYSNAFEATAYENAYVYVAEESFAKYKAADPWKNFANLKSNKIYQLTYIVDGQQYAKDSLRVGQSIIPREKPSKMNSADEVREFKGWEGLYDLMPDMDIEVTGKFKYELSYEAADGSETPTSGLPEKEGLWYGDDIVLPASLEWPGHVYTVTYSDSTVYESSTMPANDVVVYVKYTQSEQELEINNIKYKVVSLEVDNVKPHAEVIASPNKTGNVEIPDSIKPDGGISYPVTIIHDDAFNSDNSRYITGVTLHSGLKKIGARAFYNCRFTQLEIPATVESIGNDAYRYCQTMQTVIFNANSPLTELPNGVFQACTSLISIQFPKSLKTIGASAFASCSSVEAIEFPSTMETIGNSAFSGCKSLKTVILPPNLKSIGEYAFDRALGDGGKLTLDSLTTELPEAKENTFDQTTYDKTILKTNLLTKVVATDPWKNFQHTESIDSISEIGLDKCEKPQITYKDKKLVFTCGTKGATIVYDITVTDQKNGEVTQEERYSTTLVRKYVVKAYARKTDMKRSDTETYELYWYSKGDVNDDGAVTVTDAVEIIDLVVKEPTLNE